MNISRCFNRNVLLTTTVGTAAWLLAGPVLAQSGSRESDSPYFDMQSRTPATPTRGQQNAKTLRRAFVQSIRQPQAAVTARPAPAKARPAPRAPTQKELAPKQWADGRNETADRRSASTFSLESALIRRGPDPYDPRVWSSRNKANRLPQASKSHRRTGPVSFNRQMLQEELLETPPAVEILDGPSFSAGDDYTMQYRTGQYGTDQYGTGQFGTGLYEPGPGVAEDCSCFGCRTRGWFDGWGVGYGGGGGCETDSCRASSCLGTPDNVSAFVGIHAFKGPLDDGEPSNFGFQEGFNLAGPLRYFGTANLGYQIGYQATQSQLSGTLTTDDTRNQNFLTFGVFRRRPVGFQWGIVWDWLNDDYHERHNLHQIRMQTSVVNCNGREVGFWTAIGTVDDSYEENGASPAVETVEAVDQFAFFYRWRLRDCGNARLWAGFTGGGEGLFGGDLTLPMSDRWALQGSFNYLIPDTDNPPIGTQQESWNLGFNMVWYLGCKAKYTECCSLYKPMFSVADNGTFFVD